MNSLVNSQDLSEERIGACFNVPQGARGEKPWLHKHPHFEMLYIMKGVREMEFNGQLYKACPGDLMVFKPGDEHEEFRGTEKVSYFFLRFKTEDLAGTRLLLPSRVINAPVTALPDKGVFIDLFNRMLEEREAKTEDSKLLLKTYLVEFLVKLRRAIAHAIDSEGGSMDSLVTEAIKELQRDAGETLNIEDVARNAFMSSSHFSHAFKARVGESPKAWQLKRRLERATEMLAETQLSAMEIARKLGYADPYFFYRQFRKKIGMTPSEYRESLKK